MSRRKDPRKQGRVEVQDAMHHNPFAQALGGGELAPESAPQESAPPSETPLAFAAKVVLRREKKGRGGKTVTRIDGLLGSPKILEATARSMGKALGARAFVEDGLVWISGDQCQSAQRWLRDAGASKIVLGN